MITIDNSKTDNLTEFAKTLLKSHYIKDNETIQQTFAKACVCYSGGDDSLAQRLYAYVSNGWFMFASPVLSNAVWPGKKAKGLPISCFVSYVGDSIEELIEHSSEIRWMSVKGGGVGGYWGDVRSLNDTTPGPIGFLHTIDADMTAYKQGKTRRGGYATYLDISHPDIIEFIKMRVPTGDLNRKNLNLHHGINISDAFLEAVFKDLSWDLIDPHTKKVVETLKARYLWETILETRFRTGEPYINYLDEANRRLPQQFKDLGFKIHSSNLCNEIHLVTAEDRSAVCCLSSVNLAKYDEWKDTRMVSDLITMLDNVLQFYIDNAPESLQKTITSAIEERSLGLGAMGFHDYLQSKMIPWESATALSLNRQIFAHIKNKALYATTVLGIIKGECRFTKGTYKRNSHLLAIAPNTNSSIILGVSPSIDPIASNAYTHKTRVGSYLVKNKNLEKLLETKGLNTEKVWKEILANDGSIQFMDIFTDSEKEVFKTAFELDQRWVVDMARARQEYICQGQSVNLFFPAGSDRAYVNATHLRAFTNNSPFMPLKGLYYLRTESGRKTEKVALKIQRDALKDGVNEVCLSCEG